MSPVKVMAKTGIPFQIDIYRADYFQPVDMLAVRAALADLIEGYDQTDSQYGEEGEFVFVDSMDVGEAVRRINALGHATDEDALSPKEQAAIDETARLDDVEATFAEEEIALDLRARECLDNELRQAGITGVAVMINFGSVGSAYLDVRAGSDEKADVYSKAARHFGVLWDGADTGPVNQALYHRYEALYGAGISAEKQPGEEGAIGYPLAQADSEQTVVMPINRAIRREIAEKVVEQADPGYSKAAQGEWYTDGQCLYHVEAAVPWMPWSDDTVVVSVDELVGEYGGAWEARCDFDPEPDPGDKRYEELSQKEEWELTGEERDEMERIEREAYVAAVDFCLDYVPAQVEIER